MKAFRIVARLAISSALLSPALMLSQAQIGGALAAPVPTELLSAKKIFVSNCGADSGLFPHPFSGDPNRGYNELFAALHAAGQYELVSTPAEADLVLELSLIAPNGPKEANKQYGSADPLPMFRLVVYDRPSHYVLWTFTNSVEIAFKQQTHDHNFDAAISDLVAEVKALTRVQRVSGQ
jgi:hypothetical protein